MKTIITATAATLFATNVSAVDIYQGIQAGNPDLSMQHFSAEELIGVQPSVGGSVDRYHGMDRANPDLFKGDGTLSRTSTGLPDIYSNLNGNPDLQF